MKVALVAPLEEPVPPATYGGTELVVYNLAEELAAAGHEVVLLATGDSSCSGRVEPIFSKSLRSDKNITDAPTRDAMKVLGIGRIIDRLNSEDFDIVHNHYGWRLLPFVSAIRSPVVTTFHGPLSVGYYRRVLGMLPPFPYISISDAQRRGLPNLNYVATVYNGIDCERFTYVDKPGDYAAFLGRFSREKGPVQAIRCAKAAGIPLLMAGKVDDVDKEYFDNEVLPLIDGTSVQFIGEVNHEQKNTFLGNARALLFPIDWEEPFGLVMVEAMATGTPVIATRRGSVPEVVGSEAGWIVDSVDQMTQALLEVTKIDRSECRKFVCRKFGRQTMCLGYLAAYRRILEGVRDHESDESLFHSVR